MLSHATFPLIFSLSSFPSLIPLLLTLSYTIPNILLSAYTPSRMMMIMMKHTAKRAQKRLIVLPQCLVGKGHRGNLAFPF